MRHHICILFSFKVYLGALVRNLFNEGNDVYRERDWNSSVSQYSEALSIADYAKSEEILIPKEIIEKLHINRIACYSIMVSGDLYLLFIKKFFFCVLGLHPQHMEVPRIGV